MAYPVLLIAPEVFMNRANITGSAKSPKPTPRGSLDVEGDAEGDRVSQDDAITERFERSSRVEPSVTKTELSEEDDPREDDEGDEDEDEQ
jgi:hypothetical protein